MEALEGKVAVITGAASGFGRAFALHCAGLGMRLMLSDVDEMGLNETMTLLGAASDRTVARRCDVSRADDVEALACETFAHFGAAHLLFNNAGVVTGGALWRAPAQDWAWTFGINVFGVANGIRAFVPRMLEQGEGAHIVNTASASGLVSPGGLGVYAASKHAVVALSESLQHDLRAAGARIGVSVLCPAFVDTGITNAERHRPPELAAHNPDAAATQEWLREATRAGRLSAADVARLTLDAVRAGHFYILTHPKIKGAVEARLRDVLDDRLPTNPMP